MIILIFHSQREVKAPVHALQGVPVHSRIGLIFKSVNLILKATRGRVAASIFEVLF